MVITMIDHTANEFAELCDGYDPCDPDSQPGRELCDWVKEPVDQWILDHGTCSEEIIREARDLWMEQGSSIIDEDADISEDIGEYLNPGAIRRVTPATVGEYVEHLHPMVFEGEHLNAQSSQVLQLLAPEPIIVGQLFGVPRDGGYAPILVLTGLIGGGSIEESVGHLHVILHLLNDIYGDDPEDVQVII